ncbi:MAG: hypothetical protein MI754_15565 [Chromatiales bacterium]|nr:hypothetical protein [Chromatiales bacterium]
MFSWLTDGQAGLGIEESANKITAPYQHLALQLNHEQRRTDDSRALLLVSPDQSVKQAAEAVLEITSSLAKVLCSPVLLIDLCIEHSVLANMLSVSPGRGLREKLQDQSISLGETVLGTSDPNIYFLPAGLDRSQFSNGINNKHDVVNIGPLLKETKERYAYTVLFGGSILNDPISLAVAPHVGRVLLTVVENKTSIADLKASHKSFQLSRVKNVAHILLR